MLGQFQTIVRDIVFEPIGGLFGADPDGIVWNEFLGIGDESGPLRAPFNVGGGISTWLPFRGTTEIFRAGLSGEIATRLGLDIAFQLDAGETRAALPYDISFSFPTADELAADPFFRLEGAQSFRSDEARLATAWPNLLFAVDAVFELAALVEASLGSDLGGRDRRFKLIDFDFDATLPIIDFFTGDNEAETLFGQNIAELQALFGDPTAALGELLFPPAPGEREPGSLKNGDSISAGFNTGGIDLSIQQREDETRKDESSDEKDEEAKPDDEGDRGRKEDGGSILDLLDIGGGDLVTLTSTLPLIEFDETGADPLTGAITGSTVGVDGLANQLANVNVDLDNLLVEMIARALTGGVKGNVPGFEGTVGVGAKFGPLSAGASLGYNLFDADLELAFPVNQTVTVAPEPLLTQLSFLRADATGAPEINPQTGGAIPAFIDVRVPRYSVYFNESNTFWDEGVAALLRAALDDPTLETERVVDDIALFVDFDNRRIPGAFTGETGSLAGGVVYRDAGTGGDWVQLSTQPEETEWEARSRPFLGADPDLSDLRPRDGREYRYVVYTDATAVTQRSDGRFRVDLGTAFGSRALDFSAFVGPDGIFEARLDAVTAPIQSTGFLEGAPSLDLVFPSTGDFVVQVEHAAEATVDNRTTLDLTLDVILSALELSFNAFLKVFGGGPDFNLGFGPLWSQTFPVVGDTELFTLFDESFEIGASFFDISDPTDPGAGTAADQSAWFFPVIAAAGSGGYVGAGTPDADLIDIFDPAIAPGDLIDGGASEDTLVLNRAPGDPLPASVDLEAGSATVGFGRGVVLVDAADTATGRIDWTRVLTPDRALTMVIEVTGVGGDLSGVFVDVNFDDGLETEGDIGISMDLDQHPGTVGYVRIRIENGRIDVEEGPSAAGPWTFQTAIIKPDPPLLDFTVGLSAPQADPRTVLLTAWDVAYDDGETLDVNELMLSGQLAATGGARLEPSETYGVANVENLVGGPLSDTLSGDDGPNAIDGAEGDDVIEGRGGPDTLSGGTGDDIIDVGDGPTAGPDRDEAFGGEGDDRIIAGAGLGLYDGGEDAPVGTSGAEPVDLDVVDFREAPGAIQVDLASGLTSGPWAGRHELVNIEGVAGSRFDDILRGDAGRSYLEGGDGDDVLIGDPQDGTLEERRAAPGRNDRLYGQAGNDTLIGGPGADLLDGGAGIDLASYEFAPTSVFIDMDSPFEVDPGSADPDRFAPLLLPAGTTPADFRRTDGQGFRGWAQGDKLRDIENLRGSDFDDIVFGDGGANVIEGGLGDDRLVGRGGSDTLRGEAGDDVLWTAQQDLFATAPQDVGTDPLAVSSVAAAADLLDGGADDDLAILGWDRRLVIEAPNERELPFVLNDPIDVIRYELRAPEAVLIGSLATDRIDVRFDGGVSGDLFVVAIREEGGTWSAIAPVAAATYWSQSGTPNYQHRPAGVDIAPGTSRTIATLNAVEGLIGTTAADHLEGSADADALYGAGGPDLIAAADGHDVTSFGPAQPPEEIFSFPGRGYAGVTPFNRTPVAPGGVTSDSTLLPGIDGDTGGGGPLSPIGGGSDPLPTDREIFETFRPAIDAYLASGRTLSDLETLRADLAVIQAANFAGQETVVDANAWALLDAGPGEDVLDLRYDRGLDFLPRDGLGRAEIDLAAGIGSVAGDVGLLFDVENLIGTGLADALYGDDADNVIEGGAGEDILRGGAGVDVVSFDNAEQGVHLVWRAFRAQGAGDARGDRFTQFEVIRGGRFGDVLGLTGGAFPSDAPPDAFDRGIGENDLQALDGAGGDDLLLAGRFGSEGGTDPRYLGGDGDDRVRILPFADLADRALATGTPRIVIEGGADVDTVEAAGWSEAISRSLVETAAGTEILLSDAAGEIAATLTEVEYVALGGADIALGNVDPTVAPEATLSIPEDAFAPRPALAPEVGARLGTDDAIVTSLPDSGIFRLVRNGVSTPLTLGQTLVSYEVVTPDGPVARHELEDLVFEPNQNFGRPAISGAGTPTGAILGVAFQTVARDGTPVEQPREIVLRPGDFEGAPLGFTAPTDVERAPISFAFGTAVAAAEFFGSEVALADFGPSPEDTFRLPVDLETLLPRGRAEAEQAFRLAAAPEGGSLIRRMADGTETVIEVGDAVLRRELGDLLFRTAGGPIPESATVAFAPVETMDVVVTAIPDAVQGVVFSPVVAPGFAPPGEGEFLVLETPGDGDLFLRDASGGRVAIETGDRIVAEDVGALLFEAAPERRATRDDPAEIAEDVAAANAPTVTETGVLLGGAASGASPATDPPADGVGASALPIDPTALTLRLTREAAAPVVDGVEINLATQGTTVAIDLESLPWLWDAETGTQGPLDWVRWRVEDGGDGRFYALGDFEAPNILNNSAGNSYTNIRQQIDAVNAAAATPLLELASAGSPGKSAFLVELFADDPAYVDRGAFLPRIGGVKAREDGTLDASSAGSWRWIDGSDWDFAPWTGSGPGNSGGIENTLHFQRVPVNAAENIWEFRWNDTQVAYNAPGFLLQADATTTARNDRVTGSPDDDRIEGGGGDDVLRGAAGNDALSGGDGDDALEGGSGDDTMTGGEGQDRFVLTRDSGRDLITDFTPGVDRLDVSALGLRSVAELRLEQTATGVEVHAGGSVTLLQAVAARDLDADDLIGAPILLAAAIGDAEARALAPGDALAPDELAGLRFRSVLDATGPAGRFGYEARDPWALANDAVALFGAPRDLPAIDGHAIDLAAVGATRAPNIDEIRAAEIETPPELVWAQWRVEDGGNGWWYALGDLRPTGQSNTFFAVDGYLFEVEAALGGAATAPRLIDLASVASAEENAFIYDLFKDDPDALGDVISGGTRFGPWLGAQRDSSGQFRWFDPALTFSDFTSWDPGEPNNAGGNENGLHYEVTPVTGAPGVFDPNWNDVSLSYAAPGFILETRAVTSARNDRVDGSAAGDLIDGGDGDDVLFGLGGVDTILGGDGDDIIDGGDGDDVLTGGPGGDTFVLGTGDDRVTDFALGLDRVDVGGLGLTELSALSVTAVPGGLRIAHAGGSLLLEGVALAAGVNLLADGRSAGGATITLDPRNDAPQGLNRFYEVTAGQALVAAAPELRLSAVDPDGTGTPVFTLVEAPRFGSLSLDPDGRFTYVPDPGVGDTAPVEDEFVVEASDGGLGARQTVRLRVFDTDALTRSVAADAPLIDGLPSLEGFNANDALTGGAADETIHASFGDDRVFGGGGNDLLRGGEGADRFVAAPNMGLDRILDFVDGQDRIDLTAFRPERAAEIVAGAVGTVEGVLLEIGGGEGFVIEGLSIVDFDASDVVALDPGLFADGLFGEVGRVMVDQADPEGWTEVRFANPLALPKIVAGPIGDDGPDPATVRIRDVTAEGFEIRIEEWAYLDGVRAPTELAWIAVEEGTHTLEAAGALRAGSAYLGEAPTPVTFDAPFAAAPIVLGQVATTEGYAPLTPRISAVTASGFEARLQDEQAGTGPVLPERVDWIALDPATGPGFFAALTANAVTDAPFAVSFGDAFAGASTAPALFAAMQTEDGTDPATVRSTALSPSGTSLFIAEEQSSDNEIRHTDEVVGLLALDTGPLGTPPPSPSSGVIGEAGVVTIEQLDGLQWHAVSFAEALVDPSVVIGPISLNGAQPATVRVRNVTATGFELQIDEWDYLDGGHVAETVSWIAVEAGRHVLADGTVIQAGSATGDATARAATFAESFDAAPVVLGQAVTAVGSEAITTRVSDVTADGFVFRFQEQEAGDGLVATEELDWIAVETGQSAGFFAGVTGDTVTHLPSAISFGGAFSGASPAPALFAAMQSFNGGDPSTVRALSRTASGAELFVEEERSADSETDHNRAEAVGVLAIGEGLLLA